MKVALALDRGVIDTVHIDISITLLKQYSLVSLVNTHIDVSKYKKKMRMALREDIESWILQVLLVTYFLKAFLYMFMPHFSCCIPRKQKNEAGPS